MSEMVGELLNWFYGISSELKFAVVSGIVAAIGAVIFGVAKAIAWKVDHNPPNQASGGMPTQAVGELLEDRDKRHSKEKSKLKKKMEKLKTASDDEKRTLEAEIAELRRRENNRGQALKDEHKTVSELKPILAREGNALGGDAFEKATQALESGDSSLAEDLFHQIKDRTAPDVQASARASFALAEIAEQEVRWQEAFVHFVDANRLDAQYQYLIRAQNMAHHIGNFSQAEILAREAITAAEKEFGKNTVEYSIALNNLASMLEATGRFAEAEPQYRQALEITRVVLGEGHPVFATSLNNLAGLFRATGRLDEAEPLYRQALETTRAALGADHPELGTRLNNLAGLLEETGRLEEAEPLYLRAIDIARIALGEDHPLFGISLNNLALLLESTGRYQEAEPLYRQAVAVFEKALGPDHPNTQTVNANFETFLANRPPAD